jgi:hypothetical protein
MFRVDSLCGLLFNHEERGRTFLRNFGRIPPYYMESHSGRMRIDGNNSDGRAAILRFTPEWVSSFHVVISLFARRGNGRFLKLSRLWSKRMEVNKCCSESDQTREWHHVSFAWALLCKVNDKQRYLAVASNGNMFILQFCYHIGIYVYSVVAWPCPCVSVPQ